MAVSISGDGAVTGVASINTDVSSTELGYLDGVTSAIQPQIAGAGGLVLVGQSSFSAVSSVSLDNVFSGTYDNYRVVAHFAASAGANMYMRMRAAGSDTTAGYQSRTGHLSGSYGTTTTTTSFYLGDARTAQGGFESTIFGPSNAVNTGAISHNVDPNGASIKIDMQSGYLSNTTSYDGFTLYPNAGTITGTIYVYGYAQ